MDNIRDRMHGLSANVPIMLCEDVHAMGTTGALLDRDVSELSQQHFTAGSELIVWPSECQVTEHSRCSSVLCLLMLSLLVQSVPCATHDNNHQSC